MSEREKLIEHDSNSPFVRSYNATTAGQTETVYAVRVKYVSGKEEFWNVQIGAHADKSVDEARDVAYRWMRLNEQDLIASVEAVSRTITITATDWIADQGQEA
jgi:hypothetical protein